MPLWPFLLGTIGTTEEPVFLLDCWLGLPLPGHYLQTTKKHLGFFFVCLVHTCMVLRGYSWYGAQGRLGIRVQGSHMQSMALLSSLPAMFWSHRHGHGLRVSVWLLLEQSFCHYCYCCCCQYAMLFVTVYMGYPAPRGEGRCLLLCLSVGIRSLGSWG